MPSPLLYVQSLRIFYTNLFHVESESWRKRGPLAAPRAGEGDLPPLALARPLTLDHRGLALSLPLTESRCSRVLLSEEVREGLVQGRTQITEASMLPERGCEGEGVTGLRRPGPFLPGPVSFQMSPEGDRRMCLPGGVLLLVTKC